MNNPVTAEQLGARLINGELLRAERLFHSLPLYVKEKLTCRCEVFYNKTATTESPSGYRGYRTISPSGTLVRTNSFCVTCLLPHRYSVRYVFLICEGCDRYYVPNPRNIRDFSGRGPKYTLCETCDVPARPSRRIKRGSVRITKV